LAYSPLTRARPGATGVRVQDPAAGAATYQNPLYRDVADPFILKFRGEYYLYRTAVSDHLDVLISRDLVHWKQGPEIWRPDRRENHDNVWAPEVTYDNGRFLLYFAAGNA